MESYKKGLISTNINSILDEKKNTGMLLINKRLITPIENDSF